MHHLVFVYGTLKTGKKNHGFMLFQGGVKVNEGFIEGYELWDLGPYPLIVPSSKVYSRVEGEVYVVPAAGVYKLDWFEQEYSREQARFISGVDRSRDPFTVEVYVWLNTIPKEARIIPTGSY